MPITLEAIGAHAHSLRDVDGEISRSRMHADICASRKIEIEDQKLRSFVIKHSVVRVHFLVAFAVILILSLLLGPARVELGENIFEAFMLFFGLVIVASTRSIARAVGTPRE